MKRLEKWFLLVGMLLGGVGEVSAQEAPGSRAQVYAVPTTGEAGRFQVPQVKLPDATIASRINRTLLRHFRNRGFGADEIDSTASPRQQLRQAVRVCCFDESSQAWMAGGQGFSNTEYTVLLNQGHLLSLAFMDSWQGLEQPGGPHLTFDLRTGRVLTVADLVADPPAQLSRRLQAAISRRLRDELGKAVEIYGDDSSRIDDVARLYQLEHWDTTPKRGLVFDMADGTHMTDDEASFSLKLREFALTPDALLLFYTVGMSRVNFEFLPDETYTFPWARIQPLPILAPVVQASQARPKTAKRR